MDSLGCVDVVEPLGWVTDAMLAGWPPRGHGRVAGESEGDGGRR
jgi:hypothetical protein